MTKTLLPALALVWLATAGPSAQSPDAGFRITALAPRPEYVSGGDVLVHVSAPPSIDLVNVQVMLNGGAVAPAFRRDERAHSLTGLVTGLRPGLNTISVAARGEAEAASRLDVINYPVTGPIFSGPHESPFICQTDQFTLPSGRTLGKALDQNCSIRTRVDYYYRPATGGNLKPLPASLQPADAARVTTMTGAVVPFIVRVETGTINRAIYQIAILHNPASEAAPDFTTRPQGWNGRLIYTFGGGCPGGWYRQGARTASVVDEVMLQRGYAVASSSLNVFGNNCAELLAIETMMMVKERFIEAYGMPAFTIGWGGSGGSYQQHQIADGYPGLLDGIIPARSFPDLVSATVPSITDARLLQHYFDTLATSPYTDQQKREISGFGTAATLKTVYGVAGRIHVTEHCPDVLPHRLRYDPAKNRTGARCDVYDHAVNVYGRDPRTGFARRPLDNVGIQYGLAAFNAGAITAAQFLDLNEKIGGFDMDGNMVAARTEGDRDAIRAAYRSGRVTSGGGGLATTPIIDYRGYLDDLPEGHLDLRYHSFSMRARLMKANGYADNHVILIEDTKGDNPGTTPVLSDALNRMDQWLTRLSEDTSTDSPLMKLRRAKPADLVDACWTRDGMPRKIAEPATYREGTCESLYPARSFPRGVAGAPVAADIIKCQLKPIDPADYTVSLAASDMARLRRIFPEGVCDWFRPGVGQQ